MVKFQLHHQQAYGLEIVARDPDSFAVTGVRCLFCVYLGREPAPENAQRQRRKGVQVWQKFAPQNYRSHHEGQHAAQWARYQDCSKAEKAAFFGAHKSGEEVKGSGDGSGGGGGGVSSAAAAAAVVVVSPAKEKRARGRPRVTANSVNAGGVAPIQWSEHSEARLMQLRFVSWFADPANESNIHDGWVLIASALAEEFGVPVDVEQCKTKFNLRKAPLQLRSRVEHEESSSTTSRNSVDSERQDPRSNRPQHSESEKSVGIGVGVPSLPGAVVAVIAASTSGSRTNVETSPAASAVGIPKRLRGRPRRIEEEPILPVARSNNATISTLLNAEEPAVETSPPPPRKRQREHVQDASVMRREEAEANGASSSINSSSNSSVDVNTLLLTRILRVLEDHTEATRAQTRSNQELLAFLRQREF